MDALYDPAKAADNIEGFRTDTTWLQVLAEKKDRMANHPVSVLKAKTSR
jgi:hypothetical protein